MNTTEKRYGGDPPKPQQRLKLAVVGATGGTGLELVRQAGERGHVLTAFVRSPERLEQFRGRIQIIQGDPLNTDRLRQVIAGHDAVLSGLGPRLPVSKADSNLLERFAVALTTAMPRAGVRRAIIASVGFLFKDSLFPPAYVLGRLFFRGIVADASAMERTIANTDLDWTVVRPPQLTDKLYTGRYRVREGHLPRFGLKVSRADLADLMITLAETGASIRKVVGIAN